jgi:hypothetical protein
VGELLDFILGLVRIDIAADDGVSPTEKYKTGFGILPPDATDR